MNLVIQCPCHRCANRNQLALLRQRAAHIETAIIRHRAIGWLFWCEAQARTVRYAFRYLRRLPARFEAWIEAADASRFIAICDRASEKVFIGIVVVIGALFLSGILDLLLEATR